MRKTIFTTLTAAAMLGLAACSGVDEAAVQYDMAEADITQSAADGAMQAEPAAAMSPPQEGAENSTEIPVSKPQIAYKYDYGFRLPSAEIPTAQQAHIALCNQMPDNGCRVLNMSNSGGEGEYGTGNLHLEVAAPKAPAFGERLAEAVDQSGGSQISATIAGEDLSKKIVDTEARLRSRVLLSQRLTELLRTRKGTVAELVEAERAVTDVNEEIDQARSWLKEMRGRVAYSTVIINYYSSAPGSGSFSGPIRESFNDISSMLGYSIGALITLIAVTLPWILLLALAIYLRRRFKGADRTFWGHKIKQDSPAED
ncbi:DUF4349 domain-containing protein [Parasphingorhabdus cellanae]|uniref:DUF4349 domain-containing protein n=1 Tax=Parasphingorhabdus cellanae TaxID=2806553 RepID=A0ABX7T968_9SPHN|nr:DUF4349 domain-containing protein [Parasphingorhabdus cellanae]QTD57543.1 DUF4349 domain-containing protein [Parasphingorhabdus cellanae]